jgi:nucleoside phosphorylase
MGSLGANSALNTTINAIQDLSPGFIINVGIAFGCKPDEQKIGDILVSERLVVYEQMKIDAQQGNRFRGSRVDISTRLLQIARAGQHVWQESEVHLGTMFSGEKLVNSTAFLKELEDIAADAIGGEMEGAGIYAASHARHAQWIVIKAISDWADGEKAATANTQPFAAQKAASFVRFLLTRFNLQRPQA